MIKGSNRGKPGGMDNDGTLPDYWQGYFRYKENAPELYAVANGSLMSEFENARNLSEPYIDSGILVRGVIEGLNSQSDFESEFKRLCPNLDMGQILGMHLYDIIVTAKDVWEYTKIKNPGKEFAHSAYWKPKP